MQDFTNLAALRLARSNLRHHSVNSTSHNVNGDIAIQWEWSNFDPSQIQTP